MRLFIAEGFILFRKEKGNREDKTRQEKREDKRREKKKEKRKEHIKDKVPG